MIAIINITPDPKTYGAHTYSLRINHQELCQFVHNREDGLTTCLKKASDAYLKNVVDMLMEYKKESL